MREFGRRGLIQAVGSVTGLATLSTAGQSVRREDSKASVTFDDQTTDGREVTVAEVSTSVDAMYAVRATDADERHARGQLSAGTDVQEFTVRLDTPLTEDRRLAFSLYPSDGGSSLDRDTAEVVVSDDVEYLDGLSVTRVDPDPDSGFHYPYFLYAPPVRAENAGGPMLVEPNNTGTSTDDFEKHESRARDLIENGYSRNVSGALGVPMLVPVFPRPRSDPVDWTHYVHQLDRDTMQLSDGPLERVDLQLLRMVEHAKEKLADASYPVGDDIIMNGFSASGNFVDRFTVLHPDRVVSVTVGGLNGMAMLPLEEAKGHTLNYHVGIADVEELTGEPVDLDALDEVNQFLYMGAEDDNDTIPYTDAWTSDEMRETALAVYGEDMIEERFPYCQSAYETAGVQAQFRVYEGVGHTPRPAREDIVEFHRRSIEGEDVTEFGQQLGLVASFERTPSNPGVGESVTFDATDSKLDRGEILTYTWNFGNGGTAAGGVVDHAFEEPGEYTVSLTVVDSNGRTAETESTLTVGAEASESDRSEETRTRTASDRTNTGVETTTGATERPLRDGDETDTREDDTDGVGMPGFGVGTVLASVGGAVYLLRRRLRGEREE